MKTFEKFFPTFYRILFAPGVAHCCPVCKQELAMQVPLIHVCK